MTQGDVQRAGDLTDVAAGFRGGVRLTGPGTHAAVRWPVSRDQGVTAQIT